MLASFQNINISNKFDAFRSMSCVQSSSRFRSTLALSVVVSVLGLAGCASKEVHVDNSPLVRAATVITHIDNNGIKGQFAASGNRTVKTVNNMRREDDAFKFTGSIMSRLGGSGNKSDIIRLDRELMYRLDNKRKTYQECPLSGCGTLFDGLTEGRSYEEDVTVDEAQCQLDVIKNDVSLERTGQQRDIRGFPADEYLLSWKLVLKDDTGEQMQSELTASTWTTPISEGIAEAVELSEQFNAAHRKALGVQYPENLTKSLPPEALQVIKTYLMDTASAGSNNFLIKLSKLETIEGYPLSHAIEWKATSGTCASPAEPQRSSEDNLDVSSVKGLLGSIGKKIVKQEVEKKKEEKLREIGLAPVFSYMDTVQSITIEDLRSSQLDVPAKYKLLGRR